MSRDSGKIIGKDEGRVLHAFGEEVRIHLDGDRTGGKVTMWTEVTPPGGGPPPHYHDHEDEIFHVLDGRVAFMVKDEWNELGPGGAAFMPRGIVHTFKNVGNEPSRMLISTMPSGFENFFTKCVEKFSKPKGPDMQRIIEIGAAHGIHFLPS